MIVINNVDSQKFSFNGVEYFKNFTPVVVGNKIRVLNTYDSSIELTDAPRLYSEFEVDGVVYASVSLLQTALLPILYTRNSLLGDFLSSDITDYTPATTPLSGTEKALIHDGTDFKEVAVSEFGGGDLDPFLVDLTKYSWYHWKPYSTGWFGNFLPNVVGTADNISSIFTGNDLVRATRRRYKSSTSTAGSSVEFYDSIRQTQIGDGFIFTLKFGNEDASTVANARFFGGLYSSLTAIGNVNPSTLSNILGIGADSGDTNLQLIHNDATGTAIKIDLGVNFPANNLAEDVYLIQILNVRNSSDVFVRVTRVNTDTIYETTLTTDLPVSTSGGYVTPHLWRNNGTTALEVKLSCIDMNLYKLL